MRALWWWVDRWRTSSAYVDLTVEEQGFYRNLLDECCLRDGGIPDDAQTLAKASGDPVRWRKCKAHVMQRFQLVDGVWRNRTLDGVLEESKRRAAKQAAYRAGRKK